MSVEGIAKLLPGAGGPLGKILPQHVAGMLGLPYVGNVIYVDPTAGSDTANSGTSQNDALKTVVAAEDKTVSGKHDVVIIAPTGGSGRTAETSQLVWDKRFTHLIGSAAPTYINPRAGIGFGSGVSTPSMTISNNGCIFRNITIAQFNDVESNVMVKVTGNENYFGGVHFAGTGNALTGDDAAASCVTLSAAEENLFEGCTFGLDTVVRTAANASLRLEGLSKRNAFHDCLWISAIDASAPFHVLAATQGVERWAWFKRCTFINADISGGVSTMTDVLSLVTGQNDLVYFDHCSQFGASGWTSAVTEVYLSGPVAEGTSGTATIATA